MPTSTTDLSSSGVRLAPAPLTPEEREHNERLARRAIARQHDADTLLEMLGLKDYESGTPPKRERPINHGTRNGYNLGCGRQDAPPCPATPSCKDKHNEYCRHYRQGLAA